MNAHRIKIYWGGRHEPRLVLTWGPWGVTVGCQFWPDSESWGTWEYGFWHVTAFGVALWRDTMRRQTVGERGMW